ncbi:MAG: long-chain fatty acid--CoA ligase [Dehalococcoidia bacterium]
MLGTMMDFELTVGSILRHANRFHGDREIASRLPSGEIGRYTYRDLYRRCGQLSNALAALGVKAGDRVGTLAANSFRHLEAYFAAPAMGAVVHTINPRLYTEQIAYIINHAEDAVLLVDPENLPIIQQLRGSLPHVKHVVVLDESSPDGDALAYDSLLAQYSDEFDWPVVRESSAAALCYTSGTTGDPKGVLYTHRSAVLHAMMVSGADWFAVRKRDTVLPVVPMYHVMAWSLPFAATMNGAKLVLPRTALDSASLLDLIRREQVTLAAGVPTIWSDMLAHLETEGGTLAPLQCVIVGGTAPTPALIRRLEEGHGVRTLHGWGMTETSSNGLLNTPDEHWTAMPREEQREFLRKQGRPPYPVNVKILTADGNEAPWDGKTLGHLCVSGPTIARGYYKRDSDAHPEPSAWLDTGDIATIDSAGYVEIADRDKDIIKSGGEWISSIALENIAASHPDVVEAAVIAVPHPRWDERPLLIVVPRRGAQINREALLAHFVGKVTKWSIPDEVLVVESLPRQATGKLSKAELRKRYGAAR